VLLWGPLLAWVLEQPLLANQGPSPLVLSVKMWAPWLADDLWG